MVTGIPLAPGAAATPAATGATTSGTTGATTGGNAATTGGNTAAATSSNNNNPTTGNAATTGSSANTGISAAGTPARTCARKPLSAVPMDPSTTSGGDPSRLLALAELNSATLQFTGCVLTVSSTDPSMLVWICSEGSLPSNMQSTCPATCAAAASTSFSSPDTSASWWTPDGVRVGNAKPAVSGNKNVGLLSGCLYDGDKVLACSEATIATAATGNGEAGNGISKTSTAISFAQCPAAALSTTPGVAAAAPTSRTDAAAANGTGTGTGTSKAALIGGIVGGVVALLAAIGAALFLVHRRRKRQAQQQLDDKQLTDDPLARSGATQQYSSAPLLVLGERRPSVATGSTAPEPYLPTTAAAGTAAPAVLAVHKAASAPMPSPPPPPATPPAPMTDLLPRAAFTMHGIPRSTTADSDASLFVPAAASNLLSDYGMQALADDWQAQYRATLNAVVPWIPDTPAVRARARAMLAAVVAEQVTKWLDDVAARTATTDPVAARGSEDSHDDAQYAHDDELALPAYLAATTRALTVSPWAAPRAVPAATAQSNLTSLFLGIAAAWRRMRNGDPSVIAYLARANAAFDEKVMAADAASSDEVTTGGTVTACVFPGIAYRASGGRPARVWPAVVAVSAPATGLAVPSAATASVTVPRGLGTGVGRSAMITAPPGVEVVGPGARSLARAERQARMGSGARG
ncbi:hypothetical protein GGF31_004305 [Allomyces arbusculus]|nr:hypothetical protein GGF31_004305 [Allomyces arbusculus]